MSRNRDSVDLALFSTGSTHFLTVPGRIYSYWSIFLLCLQCFVVFFPEWFKMTDFDPLFGSKLMVRKGIWHKCVRVSPGVHNCDEYLSAINEIPMFLMWSRVNAILGLVCHLEWVRTYQAVYVQSLPYYNEGVFGP